MARSPVLGAVLVQSVGLPGVVVFKIRISWEEKGNMSMFDINFFPC